MSTVAIPSADGSESLSPSPALHNARSHDLGCQSQVCPRGATHAERVEFWLSRCVPDENGCLVWPGSTNADGYACVRVPQPDGSRPGRGLHRVVYEHLVGPIPEGYDLDHVRKRGCRSRACCNVDHLEPVPHRENLVRGDTTVGRNAAKTHCIHGHEFTPENTAMRASGARTCRACVRRRNHARTKEIPCQTC